MGCLIYGDGGIVDFCIHGGVRSDKGGSPKPYSWIVVSISSNQVEDEAQIADS